MANVGDQRDEVAGGIVPESISTVEHATTPMQEVLTRPSRLSAAPVMPQTGGIVIGTLVAVQAPGQLFVDFPGNTQAGGCMARATVPVDAQQIGAEVVLAIPATDGAIPVILGIVRPVDDSSATTPVPLDVTLDGERITLTGTKEIVLRCGEASITLTQSGKVLIKGEYVSTHSTGVNRIKGGSVQVN